MGCEGIINVKYVIFCQKNIGNIEVVIVLFVIILQMFVLLKL